jgi:hypothetical protein
MKTKTNSILLFAFTLSCVFLFNTCKKNNSDPCAGLTSQTHNYYVSPDNKSKIPYTGTETLVFVSNTGDTVTLYGQGKQSAANVFSAPSSNDPDCGNIISYWDFENILITFKGSNIVFNKFVYGLGYSYMLNGFNPPTPISDNGLGFELSSGNGAFISFGTSAAYANDSTKYVDTVTINGSLYKGVDLYDSSKVIYNYH